MPTYRNLGGDSGIASFETDDRSIEVTFDDGSSCVYDDIRPGVYTVGRMKQLAVRGQGLNEYINKHVRKNYARRTR